MHMGPSVEASRSMLPPVPAPVVVLVVVLLLEEPPEPGAVMRYPSKS
jgi:hypothetical protein